MDTAEKNKVIMKFLDVPKSIDSEYDLYSTAVFTQIFEDIEGDDPDGKHFYSLYEMKFDTNWHWLMCLIDFLKGLGAEPMTFDKLDQSLLDIDIDGTYEEAVNLIINWEYIK